MFDRWAAWGDGVKDLWDFVGGFFWFDAFFLRFFYYFLWYIS